jgi:transposase
MEIEKIMYEKINHLLPKPRKPLKISNFDVFKALLYVLENGCKWRALPEKFGNWHTIYTKLNRWSKNGVLERIFIYLQKIGMIAIDMRILALDSTSVKVHPDGHGALKKTENKQLEDLVAVGTQKFIWLPRLPEIQ